MADYYKNNATGLTFISVDEGETLIGPTGKKIACNDKLFTELEDEAPITDIQEKAIELAEDFEEKKDAGDKELKEKNTTVVGERMRPSIGLLMRLNAFVGL